MKKVWRLWCKALGEKATPNDQESDKIAIIRSFIFLSYLITNIAIVANAIRHWNDVNYTIKINDQQIQCGVSTTKEQIRVLE